jgi:hypothetical protein
LPSPSIHCQKLQNHTIEKERTTVEYNPVMQYTPRTTVRFPTTRNTYAYKHTVECTITERL